MLTDTTTTTLHALLDAVIPADEHPSATQAGVGGFLARRIEAGDPLSAGSVRDGVAGLDGASAAAYGGRAFAALTSGEASELLAAHLDRDDALGRFLRVVVELAMQGYYGDPGNGGNRDGRSWSEIGYRPGPKGGDWPERRRTPPPLTTLEAVRAHYDAIVVGSGAGGGVAACVLAEAGLSVLLVERGRWLDADDLRADHLRSQRLQLGYPSLVDPAPADHPRVFVGAGGPVVVEHTDPRWHDNAITVGGGTRVYGAQAWRFCAEDFRMASEYGVPEGSSLADWPISVEELEPDYDRAEWELGVSGAVEGNRHAGPRRRGYPMPPLPPNGDALRLREGADRLGLGASPVPLLINSTPYNGRGACMQCGACVGFACPGEFKTDSRNTVVARALATGRCDLVVETQADRIATDADGRITGVSLVARTGDRLIRRVVDADQVLLGAGAIETARLLLNSRTDREPAGIGNDAGQVGRHLQGHVYAGAVAVFDEPVQDSIGPGPGIATNDFRHGNPGIVGGAMIANDFVPMPLFVRDLAVRLGAMPRWGAEAKAAMRHLYPRLALVMGPVQEVPGAESRVEVDPDVVDAFGIPVARLSGSVHGENARTAAFIADRAVEWATASGAVRSWPMTGIPDAGPSGGQHQAGTCRMGTDPSTSVTDRWGAVWGHDNLRVVDASLHVTNGGVNPVLTVLALAYRVSRHLVEEIAAR